MLTDEIFALARVFAPSDDPTVLRTLCKAAQHRLEKKLKKGVTADCCAESFVTAAALAAAAQYQLVCGESGLSDVASFSVADVKIVRREQEKICRAMQKQADELMAPYCEGTAYLMGVRT